MTFVKANGLVIHYVDEGRRDGPPFVFINAARLRSTHLDRGC
jgi:hypothetical protein